MTSYFNTLVRRWQIVLAMPILAMLAAVLVTFATKPTYEATATIALAPATLSIPTTNQLPPYYLTVDSPRRLPIAYTPTYYVALLKDASIVNQVAPRAAIAIAANGSDRSLLEITARGDDAKIVAETANAYADAGAQRIIQILMPSGDDVAAAQKKLETAEQALVKFSQDNGLGEFDPAKLRTALGLTATKRLELDRLMRERDNTESVYNDFAREYERAAILAGNVYKPRVITTGTPTAPVAPKLAQNVLIAGAFGLLVGIAGAFAVDYLSRR